MTAQPQSVQLEPMREADFAIVASLGERIWRSHYARIISVAQIEYMLAGRYTPERLRAYLHSDVRWLDILRRDGEAVGYCSYALTAVAGALKLEQLYLLPELHGRGLGRCMLDHVEAQARARGCGAIVLTVNKKNDSAIAMYRHRGFSVREEAVFDIGNGFVMDDYVMEKRVL